MHQVPPPLPSAPPVGSQWDLRQLQLNSPIRSDQPPTPTTPRATPEREGTPDNQQSMLLFLNDLKGSFTLSDCDCESDIENNWVLLICTELIISSNAK